AFDLFILNHSNDLPNLIKRSEEYTEKKLVPLRDRFNSGKSETRLFLSDEKEREAFSKLQRYTSNEAAKVRLIELQLSRIRNIFPKNRIDIIHDAFIELSNHDMNTQWLYSKLSGPEEVLSLNNLLSKEPELQ